MTGLEDEGTGLRSGMVQEGLKTRKVWTVGGRGLNGWVCYWRGETEWTRIWRYWTHECMGGYRRAT